MESREETYRLALESILRWTKRGVGNATTLNIALIAETALEEDSSE